MLRAIRHGMFGARLSGDVTKWIGNLIHGLLLAALGAIVLAYIQPVIQYVSPEAPLKATIEASRWLEKPTKAEVKRTIIKDDPEMEKLFHDVWMNPEQNKFLAVLLSNEGKETAKDLRMWFEDEDERPTAMVVTNDGLDRQVISGKSNILLPDMKPGEKIRIYLWAKTAFPRELLPDSLRLFSSIGQFQITYSQPEKTDYFVQKSAFFKFVDRWISTIFGGLIIAMVVLLFAALYVQQKYFRKLLADLTFHAAEKTRYDTDPSTFTPTM